MPASAPRTPDPHSPLRSLDEWEDFLVERYPDPRSPAPTASQGPEPTHKAKDDYRNYENPGRDTVREFYRLNHRYQTRAFVQAKKAEFLGLNRRQMSVWEAAEFLNHLVDDSDPDTSLSQLQHLMQTSEAIRADGHPDWFVLTGFLHDLGKILCLFGESQWAVVGDTFPVGCRYSDKIVYPEFFEENTDWNEPRYQTLTGVYSEGCGLSKVDLSWGHDEYLYHVVKHYLPEPALYMIRYHSFYPGHREGEYQHLMNDQDRKMFEWVRAFNPYDLYTKSHEKPNVEKLRPFYQDLIAEFFPEKLRW